MNKFIEQQLRDCQVATIPEFNSQTSKLLIKKLNQVKLDIDSCYLVELSDSLLNPPTNSLLVINWNNGSIPKSKYYKVDVLKIMSKMVFVNGIAYDKIKEQSIPQTWQGWLPINDIIVLKKL